MLSNYLFLNRKALEITETELKLMAAAAITGLSSIPKNGNSIPAATGTPKALYIKAKNNDQKSFNRYSRPVF